MIDNPKNILGLVSLPPSASCSVYIFVDPFFMSWKATKTSRATHKTVSESTTTPEFEVGTDP